MAKWVWTAFCSMPDDPKGQYSEEIDIIAFTAYQARKMAEAILEDQYDPGLKVRKVVRRAPVIENRTVLF